MAARPCCTVRCTRRPGCRPGVRAVALAALSRA
jgi:hypothetical protein